MLSTIRLNASDLNESLIQSLKEKFKGKFLEIVVREADDDDYLRSSASNAKFIDEAIARIEKGEGLIAVDFGKAQIR